MKKVSLCFPLTPRQWVIARHIAEGKSHRECARELNLSLLYVHQVVSRIGIKLSGTEPPTDRIRAWWPTLD